MWPNLKVDIIGAMHCSIFRLVGYVGHNTDQGKI